MRLDTLENFWTRLFGSFVRGDIIETGRTGSRGLGVYWTHYELYGVVHLFLLRDMKGETHQMEEILVSPRAFRESNLLVRIEELTSYEDAVRKYKEILHDK